MGQTGAQQEQGHHVPGGCHHGGSQSEHQVETRHECALQFRHGNTSSRAVMPPRQQHPFDHSDSNHDVNQQSAREDLAHDVSPIPRPAPHVVIIVTGYRNSQTVCASLHRMLSAYSDTYYLKCNPESPAWDVLRRTDFGNRGARVEFLLGVID